LGISRNGRYICGVTGGFPRLSWFVDLGSTSTGIGSLQESATVLTAFPNPVAGDRTTTFQYESAKSVDAVVTVFDLQGRVVKTLAAVPLVAGTNRIVWDLADDRGVRVPAGSYLVTVSSQGSRSRTTVIVQ
jgi:flagellar hook assembly protein FlgD